MWNFFSNADNVRTFLYMCCYVVLLVVISILAAIKNTRKIHEQQTQSVAFSLSQKRSTTMTPDFIDSEMGLKDDDDNKNDSRMVSPVSVDGMEADMIADWELGNEAGVSTMKISSMSTCTTNVNSRSSTMHSNCDGIDMADMPMDQEGMNESFTCFECLKIFFTRDFIVKWGKDILKQRSIYGIVVTYAFDIITDLNVMIFWFNHSEYLLFAILSFMIQLIYRIVSCFSVYKASSHDLGNRKRLLMALLQFCDLYIFYEVFRSYQEQRKSQRLYWLNAMEAAMEAAPQIILQIVFLLSYTNYRVNFLVVLGLLFSVWKLGATLIGADTVNVCRQAKGACASHKYYIRFFFRTFEVSSRIFVYVLIWVLINPLILAIIMIMHTIHNIILYESGCLGRELFNIVGFILYIPKINKTLQEGKINKDSYFYCCGESNWYIKFYRKYDLVQTPMMLIRSIELIIYEILMGIVYFYFATEKKMNSTKQMILECMFFGAIIMSCLTPLFWFWMLQQNIIDFEKKKEEIAYKNIYKAIAIGRLDAIIEQFNTGTHLTQTNDKLGSPLHYACYKKQDKIVSWMMNQSGFFNDSAHYDGLDSRNETPFLAACKSGCVKCIKILMQYNIRTTSCNDKNENCFHLACKHGNDKVVEHLLSILGSMSPTISIDEMLNSISLKEDFTPMHMACSKGHIQCVKLLLKQKNSNINKLNSRNLAPIHLAVKNKHNQISLKLINDENFELSQQSAEKLWYYCIKYNNSMIMEKLMAWPKYKFDSSEPVTYAVQSHGSNFGIPSDHTPIFIATNNNSFKIVGTINKHNDNDQILDTCNSKGFTPLYIACMQGHYETATMLLQSGKVDIFFKTKENKNTIFMAICQGGNEKIAKAMITHVRRKHDAASLTRILYRVNSNGDTPIHIACQYNSFRIIEILAHLYKEKAWQRTNNQGYTPEMIAKQRKHQETLLELNLIKKLIDDTNATVN